MYAHMIFVAWAFIFFTLLFRVCTHKSLYLGWLFDGRKLGVRSAGGWMTAWCSLLDIMQNARRNVVLKSAALVARDYKRKCVWSWCGWAEEYKMYLICQLWVYIMSPRAEDHSNQTRHGDIYIVSTYREFSAYMNKMDFAMPSNIFHIPSLI